MNVTAIEMSAESLREAMIDKAKEAGYARSRAVEDALRAIERHHYVPDVDLIAAYANDIVVTKRGIDDSVLRARSKIT